MGLQHRSRAVLHIKLTEVVGDEEAVGDMLSPSTDLETPATKDFVRAEINELKAYVHAEIVSSMRWTLGIFITAQTIVIGLILGFS